MTAIEEVDLLVIGGGPSGQKAAVQGAKAGMHVMLVDREKAAGGECVHRGTIPSKTLRESAIYLQGLRRRASGAIEVNVPPTLRVMELMRRLRDVQASHEQVIEDQLRRNEIETRHGRASFLDAGTVEVVQPRGRAFRIRARTIVLATGSRPRVPENIAIDHDHVLDSDSILSMIYLPRSLCVLGGGVVACEFASIFAALGVQVVMIDRAPRPLFFLDPELSAGYVEAFREEGGLLMPGREAASATWDGEEVVTRLTSGEAIRTERLLCAQGRVANVDGLHLERAGIAMTERGHVRVDEHCRTSAPGVYAVGDVIGPPALAATAMEQGRRAVRHALGLDAGGAADVVPIGIYTVPEIASVGQTEAQVIAAEGSAVVGRSPFRELARGQISGHTTGLLKLVCGPDGRTLRGAQIVGENATELIHVAQMAILGGLPVDVFVENPLNFPTMAEAYRVAALDAVGKRAKLAQVA